MLSNYPGVRYRETVVLGYQGFQMPATAVARPAQGFMRPLLAYGALAAPATLAARLGPPGMGSLIVPVTAVGVRTVWADGGRYTLAAADAGTATDMWMLLLPRRDNVARALDQCEGRGPFYSLAELSCDAAVSYGQVSVHAPVTYLGARFRQPRCAGDRVPSHGVYDDKVSLTELALTGEEEALVSAALEASYRVAS